MRSILFLLVISLGIISCSEDRSKQFSRLEKGRTGIDFRNILEESDDFNVLNYTYFYNGGGVAIGDINNDGLPDVLFTGNMVKNRLYLNKGDFKFEDITAESGIADKQGWCTGASMVDINSDGLLDIYICRSADGIPEKRKNLLYVNNGDLQFTEKAEEYGLADQGYTTQASFFDYDRDGDLDCFVINHSLQQFTTGAQENAELRSKSNPDFASKLYRNNNGRFTDVSKEAGIVSNVFSFGLGIAVTDFNNDDWPDVYVSNDFNEHDYFFVNKGDGTFDESLAEHFDYVSLYSMGSDAADFNNDGLTDIVTLDMLPEDNYTQKMHSGAENFDKFQYLFGKGFYYQYSRNMLQKNNGDGSFSEIGQLAGISNTDWSWASLFADFDNDGHKDLYVTNGYVKDYTEMDFIQYTMNKAIMAKNSSQKVALNEILKNMPDNKISNYAFRNNGKETFSSTAESWGLNHPVVSAGAAYGDLDNDGDLDLVVNNSNEYAGVYRNNNETIGKADFLKVQLKGAAGNRNGIGTKIRIFAGNQQYYQEQMPVRGFQSSMDQTLVFGLGTGVRPDSAVVSWPDGKKQTITPVPENTTLEISYETAVGPVVSPEQKQGYFRSDSLPAVHIENAFNDFTIQRLLPGYYSRQGPCTGVADVNNDGLDDYYLGGSANQAGQLFVQNGKGGFHKKTIPDFITDAPSEDIAAVFTDVNGDGYVDLYVGSGGYEFNEADPSLQDRLYLNDGRGNFFKSKNALPQMLTSTGAVTAADMDADGDMDIFAGGRIVPGRYPVNPVSYILKNNGKGEFTDATSHVAAGIREIGMVTAAVWVDLNKDRYPELVVTGEWMPVRVYENEKGLLKDASSAYIKFESSGWWNTVKAADMDSDGDPDLIVGNLGLNTQFRAKHMEPVTLTYMDFDGNGTIDPLLSYFIKGVSYPAASRDDLADQLPMIRKKYLAYKDYAAATLPSMFGTDTIKNARELKAFTMESVYLENKGKQGFERHELPLQAQYGPVYALGILDVNSDGRQDIIMAGGNSWSRIKWGKYGANHGIVLLNEGNNRFAFLPQNLSGLRFRGDVRSLQSIDVKGKKALLAGVNNAPAILLTNGDQ